MRWLIFTASKMLPVIDKKVSYSVGLATVRKITRKYSCYKNFKVMLFIIIIIIIFIIIILNNVNTNTLETVQWYTVCEQDIPGSYEH